MTIKVLLVCSAIAILSWPVLADEVQFRDLSPLRTEQIKAALINHSVTGVSPGSGFSFTVFYPAYGKLEGEAGLWGLYQDEGTWSVKDDIYCARWQNWLENAERCYRVYLDKDAVYWVTLDGILQSKDKLVRKEKPE